VSDSRWQRTHGCNHSGLITITVQTETHSGCSLHPIVSPVTVHLSTARSHPNPGAVQTLRGRQKLPPLPPQLRLDLPTNQNAPKDSSALQLLGMRSNNTLPHLSGQCNATPQSVLTISNKTFAAHGTLRVDVTLTTPKQAQPATELNIAPPAYRENGLTTRVSDSRWQRTCNCNHSGL
jgi:hypothetical protein